MAQVPHLAFPLRLGPQQRMRVVEQDTLEEVGQCVEILLRTQEGERIELPEYGIPDQTFLVELDLGALQDKTQTWEPRAEVLFDEERARFNALIRHVQAEVRH